MDKCNCFDETLDKIKEKVIQQLGENVQDVSVKYDNYVHILDGGDYSPVNPKIKIEYKKLKKDKTPQHNLTKDSVNIMADFCCFCGRKYNK